MFFSHVFQARVAILQPSVKHHNSRPGIDARKHCLYGSLAQASLGVTSIPGSRLARAMDSAAEKARKNREAVAKSREKERRERAEREARQRKIEETKRENERKRREIENTKKQKENMKRMEEAMRRKNPNYHR